MPPRLTRIALRPRVLVLSRPLARPLSSDTRSPSNKITTAPFRLAPADALNKMYINALLASASIPNIVYAFLLRLFGPSITPLATEFGLGSKLELRGTMKAALYPAWRVDSIVEGKATVDSARGIAKRLEPKVWISTSDAYVPGNPFAPLSYLSFAVPPLPDDLPTYNPSKHLRQLEDDGLDIVPVPFTVSPLGLSKLIRSRIGQSTRWENLKIDESKFKETMVACYPLLLPIYLAEFEYDQGEDGKRQFTIVMDAHDDNPKNCRVSWPPPPHLIESGRFDKNYYVNPAPFLPNANLAIYPSPGPQPIPGTMRNKLIDAYQTWMSPAADLENVEHINPSPMVAVQDEEGDVVDWEDERIMSWSGVEREENAEYLEMALRTQKGLETLETMKLVSQRTPDKDLKGLVINTTGPRPHFERKSLADMETQLQGDIEKMKEELEDLKPGWLKSFEAKQQTEKSSD
ncbi:hypothetical protein I315_06137 [Cryptococcus gattii Ru294]|uniref:Uncharacterized protein n=1 Tax=Cryptococcus gattii serotype B (strain WM276 / ATCC MYA-4071) TaxID=367775 RepID=E6RBB2_CRYGW|nr:Hypothetical Protein CGB_H5120C [Cryptococcus gattii WM276]ADV24177.1 Hypothetical Protein CGB_H5120C [Cryptococcus gattii WM276]KIR51438.1 hypothetical protein I315_06137 [Cryptococcus gattii Ru294]KIY34861.1 hypothetical protein I305_02421 [Cryptococcus gattii E566]KJE01069.1 hypothetical protein I311_05343 [Cryptococcus gattii NT-10]